MLLIVENAENSISEPQNFLGWERPQTPPPPPPPPTPQHLGNILVLHGIVHMFPWQPYFDRHVFPNLHIFPVFILMKYFNFLAITFTFLDHFSFLLLVLVIFESFLAVKEIQDGGSKMVAVRK